MAVTEEMLSGRSEIDRRVFPRCFRGDTGPKASGGPRFDALGAGRWIRRPLFASRDERSVPESGFLRYAARILAVHGQSAATLVVAKPARAGRGVKKRAVQLMPTV
jgi:hypothetical protein